MVKQIHKGDEDRRRWNIIDASCSHDARYVPQLLARLDSDECYENKRHIVRALGNIGDKRAEPRLLQLLDKEPGLLLGDVVRSLGQLNSRNAISRIKLLMDHKIEWVRQNAKWAIERMSTQQSRKL